MINLFNIPSGCDLKRMNTGIVLRLDFATFEFKNTIDSFTAFGRNHDTQSKRMFVQGDKISLNCCVIDCQPI